MSSSSSSASLGSSASKAVSPTNGLALPPRDARRFFPALLILFAASGCAALIYEVVWYQLLQLAIGSTAVSMGVLLATFMGGLCIGSLALPRLPWSGRHPLRVYAWLEVGIGAFGLLVLVTLPLINRVYVAGLSSGLAGNAAARRAGGFLHADSDDPDGRVATGAGAVDFGDGRRRLVVGIAVRRQHGGSGRRDACWPDFICCACTTLTWRLIGLRR